MQKLSILIPAYNEAGTIHLILNRIKNISLEHNVQKEVIIIDDCSTDHTESIVNAYISLNPELNIDYYKQDINKGKGAAIHIGILKATGDFLVIQDADLEYDPQEYNILLNPILTGFTGVVYGSRLIGGRPHRILFFWHSIGNKFLTFLSNLFNNLNLTDMETSYKMFKTEIIKKIELQEMHFGFEPEITAKIARVPGIRIYEVGISYYGRN
jgi:glycosyltransferase involved in cell wall biosynthesis